MAEVHDDDPKRSAPKRTTGSPLPRLWKHTPDEADDEPFTKKKKESTKGPDEKADPKAKKKSKEPEPTKDGKKGVLVGETPELDTHEARQRIRIMIGTGMLGLFLLLGWVTYRVFLSGKAGDEQLVDEAMPSPPAAGASREQVEQEAKVLLDRAKELAKGGKSNVAVSMLKRLTTSYAGTATAVEAKEALDRPAQNLPLFLDRPTVVSSGAKGAETAPPKAAPRAVVDASPTQVAAATGAQASLVLPANPAEPAPSNVPVPGIPPPPTERLSRPLPKGFYARPATKVDASGWPIEVVSERDGAPMVLVPGGTFVQGRDNADPSEAPAHQVNLSTYYIDVHEVTVRQFNLFQKEAGRKPERARALSRDASSSALDADETKPIVMVTAREAADYAAWAAKRLPTEAQWEAAARTPDGRIFPWGLDAETPREARQVSPSMSFKKDQSPYGAFDLAGNAQEWTKDWFDPKFYQLYRNAPADNPTGPASRPRTQQLVVKGANTDWVVTRREGIKFDSRLPHLGFRCVLPVEGAGNAFEPTNPAPAGTPNAPAPAGSAVPF